MGYKIRDILGSKMCLIPNDKGISKSLLRDGIREIGATIETSQKLKKDMVCIDVGANLGYYALLEAKKTKFVYAIEPVAKNLKALKESIGLNNYTNIKTYDFAISDTDGKQKLLLSQFSNCATLVTDTRNPKRPKGLIEVKTKTLNTFCKEENISRIDFLRMDVEGGEVKVVKGMDEAVGLMPQGAMMCIEIHPKAFGHPFEPIMDMLKTIQDYGFDAWSYVLLDIVIGLKDYAHLKRLIDRKYCPQIFFRKAKVRK